MNNSWDSHLVCTGCTTALPDNEFLTLSCPQRGNDDTDHVLRAMMPAASLLAGWPTDALSPTSNPFLRYRHLSHTWRLAMRSGMDDATYVKLICDLEASIEAIDGTRISPTPVSHCEALDVTIKNETGNVSGSHKSRHLIGTAIHLEVARHLGVEAAFVDNSTLAIASCGNAALAAAVVARATGRSLQVFLPPSADASVVERLSSLGAERIVCERQHEDPPGDPCYLRFREAVAAGALPFSCQGGDNALALIGGQTLGWELIEQVMSRADAPSQHLFIQVGGGALASSILQAFLLAKSAGIIDALPRFHAVQSESAHPLVRAWRKLQSPGASLDHARSHRSSYMWPWETAPTSIASGILDDETYDWYSILEGLQASGGSALTVSETRLRQAQQSARAATGIAVDVTGTSGFAGLIELRERGGIRPGEPCTVLFTGVIR